MMFRTPFDPEPESPDEASADAMLRARIAAVPQPALPPELAERIVREVPRLAQFPAPTPGVAGQTVSGASVPGIARATVPAVSMARAVVGRPARRGKSWAGLAALAAGIAAVALIGQRAMPVGPAAVPLRMAGAAPLRAMAPGPVAPAKAASARAIPAAGLRTPTAVGRPDGGGDGRRVDPAPAGEPASGGPASVASVSVAKADSDRADDAAGVAVAAAGPAAGPADATGGVPAALGAHGVMGPTLPQGYGFTGGDFGAAYPGAMGAGSRGAGPGPGPGPH